MTRFQTYLKRHTEALVKDVGITAACELTGKLKATLGRYYSARIQLTSATGWSVSKNS